MSNQEKGTRNAGKDGQKEGNGRIHMGFMRSRILELFWLIYIRNGSSYPNEKRGRNNVTVTHRRDSVPIEYTGRKRDPSRMQLATTTKICCDVPFES